MESKIKIAKKKREKEIKRQNKKHSQKPKFPQAKEQQRSGQKEQKTVRNGNCCYTKNLQQQTVQYCNEQNE